MAIGSQNEAKTCIPGKKADFKQNRNRIKRSPSNKPIHKTKSEEASDVIDLGFPNVKLRRRTLRRTVPPTTTSASRSPLHRATKRSPRALLPNPRLYPPKVQHILKRKPPQTQLLTDNGTKQNAKHSKKRKRRFTNPVPNSRLYQPAPPHQHPIVGTNTVFSQRAPAPPLQLPKFRPPWPKPTPPDKLETASQIILALTDQISTRRELVKRSRPSSIASRSRPCTAKPKQKPPAIRRSTARGRVELVVSVPQLPSLPQVSIRSECSSQRRVSAPKRIHDLVQLARKSNLSHVSLNAAPLQSDLWGERYAPSNRFARSPAAFERYFTLDDKIDLSEPTLSRQYSPCSSFFREDRSPKLSPVRGPSFFQRPLISKTSLIQEDSAAERSISPSNREVLRAEEPAFLRKKGKTYKNKVKLNNNKAKMETKTVEIDKSEQHSTSPEEYSDGNETLSAPSEFLAEFLSAIMQRKYVNALKYCKLILKYEPNNVTAKEFYPLLEEKLKIAEKEDSVSSGAELPSVEKSPADLSEGSNQNTDKDEGSSYNSDDSYLLDDELEEEVEDEEVRAEEPDVDESPLNSSASHHRTDSDRSLPYSAGETDNSANNLSGFEDEDSSKYEFDDDNGNAVCVESTCLGRTAACYATAGAGQGEPDANENASTASNMNYKKNQEELRKSRIQQLRSQFVHSVK